MTGTSTVDALKVAAEDRDSVANLTRDLVRIPSRGGIDPYGPVLDLMESWLRSRGLPVRQLATPGGEPVGLVSELAGDPSGPRYVLDACLDTAPFGDEAAWTWPPASGAIADGWLHGRGSADSKVGVAIFAHLAARLRDMAGTVTGNLVLLFDVDEHTGGFGGAKSYFGGPAVPDRVDGVMIGYPGIEHVVTGGRGVLRARILVHGVAAHSGSSRPAPSAVAKAAGLVTALHAAELPTAGEEFPLPARLTITAITGGEGYSAVPDLCTLNVDIRLTPAFTREAASGLLRQQADAIDRAWPGTPGTSIQFTTSWPEYALPADSPLRTALMDAARESGLAPEPKIAGPSNIGNYLAGLGIPATAGFGVDYVGLHGTDERIRLDTIESVQASYHRALLSLFQQQ